MKMSHALTLIAPLALALALASAAQAEPPRFSEVTPPPAPDYASAANWASGPAGPGASAAVPQGAIAAAKTPPADVFYIHPTTFRSTTVWNQDLSDQVTNSWTDASVIARQASVFNACCRVYAPRYRQASFLDREGGRMQALALAYKDIEAAFDYYIAHYNRGRPFIIAGHSQGGFMVAELLQKRITGTPLKDQMVAAYSIGVGVAEGEVAIRFPDVPPCATPTQTGCLLQWNAMLSDADLAGASARYAQYFADRFGKAADPTPICINPVTFDRARPVSNAAEAKGAVPGDPGEGMPKPLMKGAVAAACVNGLLSVAPAAALDLKPLGGGVMHYHDYGLFYEDVRENAKLRVTAFLKARKGHK
ncbi:MAG: DUF3089 domain-containing protein [Sphingobium sp.]